MKAQTSLEFLLILSAVAALGLATVTFYGKGISADKRAMYAFGANDPAQAAVGQAPASDPGFSVYIPINSETMESNPLQADAYGCMNGSVSMELSSTSAVFSRTNVSEKVNGVSIIRDSFEPTVPGLGTVTVRYNVSCSGSSISSSRTLYTYATVPSLQSAGQYAAYIDRTNESVAYGLEEVPIATMVLSNHCTITDIWTGRIYTVPGQCGTANAWDYMVFDPGCLSPYWAYMRTYCIAPSATGYYYAGPDQHNPTYRYSISLEVDTGAGVMRANLSSGANKSRVEIGGVPVGNATVISVGGGPYAFTGEIRNNSNEWEVNDSWYSAYMQAKDSLYPLLSFYNSSGVSGSTQSAIAESITAFNTSSRNLLLTKKASGGVCSVSNSSYVCRAASPLSYIIDITVPSSMGIQNASVYYEGSVINIASG